MNSPNIWSKISPSPAPWPKSKPLAPAPGTALLEGGVAEAVVGGALRVLQDVVGLVEFLEPGLGLLVARVAVRVMLHGQLAVGLFQIV